MSLNQISTDAAIGAIDNWLIVSKQTDRTSPAVRELLDDLRAERNLSSWSRVNFTQLIPFRTQTPRMLHIVRAGCLFLPILLTWLALSQVIGPFAIYLQNVQASANFLWFWQQNPDNSFSDIYVLSHVALTDAAVLAFLLVLAMRISWWETTREEKMETVYADMLSTLERFFAPLRGQA